MFGVKNAIKNILWYKCPNYDIDMREGVIWIALNTKLFIVEHKNW